MYEKIPAELKPLKQWCCWQAMPDDSRPGKIKKVPMNARTGGAAQSNNPDTWCDFDTAVAASANHTGIGFMFSDSKYFGVDIDGVDDAIMDYQSGDNDNIIAEFIHRLRTYAEYSYSGSGIHLICKGTLPPSGRRKKNVEMYESGRFFVMTGENAAEYATIEECTQTIKPLHEKYIGGGSAPSTGIRAALPMNLSQSEIIRMAEKSKQGGAFSALYGGGWNSLYSSQSEADMAFCNMLAFWCGRDEALMDSIFRCSALMREKWDRRQSGSTYGKITIAKAARDCSKVYEPEPEYHITIGQAPAKAKRQKIYTYDDTGNAERFADTFGDRVHYSYTTKSWMYYDGRKWCKDDTGAIRRMSDELVEAMRGEMKFYVENSPADMDTDEAEKAFMKHLKNCRSNRSKTAMLAETQHRLPITPDKLDSHKSLLNTINGTINLRTGELQPHNKADYITKIANTEYTDKIDCPIWENFLLEIFDGDTELIEFLQKAVGYSLTGSTKEDCAFFCYGTGRNGKSTFIDVIADALGDYATNIQPETIMVKQSSGGPTGDIARLNSARFVSSSEPNEGVRLNEGLLKQLTGGDRVTASKKYENEFEFYPEFKLWMSTNHKPVIRGTDVGIWSRIRLIPFTVRIPDESIDRNLKHKLKQELPGILKWCVDGCLKWQRSGLKTPAAILASTAEYKGEMDVMSGFIDACIEVGAGTERAKDVFAAYAKWAKENNEYEMKSTKFGIELSKRFNKEHDRNGWYYRGFKLISEYENYSISFGNV